MNTFSDLADSEKLIVFFQVSLSVIALISTITALTKVGKKKAKKGNSKISGYIMLFGVILKAMNFAIKSEPTQRVVRNSSFKTGLSQR